MARLQAEGCDEAVDGFAYCKSPLPQPAIVNGRRRSQVPSSGIENAELEKSSVHPKKRSIVPNSLQHLAKNKVSKCERLAAKFLIEPCALTGCRTREIVDPYGRVDDDHGAD